MINEGVEKVRSSRVAETLGAELLESGGGRAKVRYQGRPEWLIPSNRLQGGFIAAMIDHAMATAVFTAIEPGQWHTTIELKVNYFRGAELGAFTAEAEVLRKGRSTVYVEATLFDEAGEMVAKGTSTCMIVRRPG